MGIIIDVIIILFIALSTYLGYKKGLIELGIQIFAFIIALLIGVILYRPIGNIIIDNTHIDEKIQQLIEIKTGEYLAKNDNNEITNQLVESEKDGVVPKTSRMIAINIVYGSTILILYIANKIVLMLISSFANIIIKFPILKQFNGLGGGLCGLARGIIVIFAILMICNAVIIFNPSGKTKQIIEESYLAKTMMNYNIFNILFKNI